MAGRSILPSNGGFPFRFQHPSTLLLSYWLHPLISYLPHLKKQKIISNWSFIPFLWRRPRQRHFGWKRKSLPRTSVQQSRTQSRLEQKRIYPRIRTCCLSSIDRNSLLCRTNRTYYLSLTPRAYFWIIHPHSDHGLPTHRNIHLYTDAQTYWMEMAYSTGRYFSGFMECPHCPILLSLQCHRWV